MMKTGGSLSRSGISTGGDDHGDRHEFLAKQMSKFCA